MVGAELFGPLAGRSRSITARRARAGFFISTFMLVLGLLAGSAQAAPEIIAEPGSDAGQVNFPVGTAVHQASGDLYVAELDNSRISKFDSDGKFLLAWGFGVRDGETAELQTCGPQASPPQGWCYSALPFLSNPGAGSIRPTAVGVDQTSGDVYVADEEKRRITKFTSSGEFVFLVGKNVTATKVGLGGGATQAEKNICTAASGDTCTTGESGTGPNEFVSPRSLTVTPSGTVWVGDTDRLTSFDSAGTPGSEIVVAGCGIVQSLAVDSAGDDVFVKCSSLPGIRKIAGPSAPVPGEPLETLDEAGQACTVTLDEAGNVYVGDETSPYRFIEFNPGGEQIAQFGAGEVIGEPGCGFFGSQALAVGEDAGKLYVASSFTDANSVVQAFSLPGPGPLVEDQGVEDIEPTTANLVARINPEGDETTYRFEYGTTEAYGQSTPTQTLAAEEFEPEDVEAGIEELIPDTTYHFRVVATNHCNPSVPTEECVTEGEDQTFTARPAVDILAQWASDVAAITARLHAKMDPLGVEAEAWLEWGTDESYGEVVTFANLGDGFGPVLRETSLTGLQAGTTYHYRFVARDERDGNTYTVHGPDQTFITQFGGLGFKLADNRVWEMVSPSDKNGAKFAGGGENALQASADGRRIAFSSKLPTDPDPQGNRFLEPSMNLASRDGNGSWHSRDITPPNDQVSGAAIGKGTEYKLFSSDLSEALIEPRSGTPLSEEASERTPYLRKNSEPPRYRPLVTGKEPFANVPPGTEFGGLQGWGDVRIVAVSPGFTHVVLQSRARLVEGPAVDSALYEWSNGQIKPVSVLPSSEGGELVPVDPGDIVGSARGAVSADGSRVFWSTGSALYVRNTGTEESAKLDVKQPGASGFGLARPVFQGASADGSVVLFSDSRRLTADAGAKGSQLYRCELPPGGIASGCATLVNISVPVEAGESAELQGVAPGVSEDAETIYFVARGVLDETPTELGGSAVSGEPNLYVWQQGEGVRYIATLADDDSHVWGKGPGPVAAESLLAASASPGARSLTFMSQSSLTGYDNRDATTGEPAHELFRYDTLADRLECVSCNPAGMRPRSTQLAVNGSEDLVNPRDLWQGLLVAATLPVANTIEKVGDGGISLYRPRAVLDNGRVFFNAIDALVPADSNGQWDVYQYEPVGIGDCLASSGGTSIVRSAGGCVSLLSSGTAEEEAAFFDASETGDDAFFFTPAQLSVLDEDHEVDIYDARVDGIEATLPPNTECLGEACQPLAQAPSDPTPASAAFSGPGNLHPAARKKCPKGKRRVQRQGRVRCVARKHRKANGNRRATR